MYGRANGECVALARFCDARQLTDAGQILFRDRCHVHQRDVFRARSVDRFSGFKIRFKCLRDLRIFNAKILDRSQKGNMAAMIRPVRIDHAQLKQHGIALFFHAEITLHEPQVILGHAEIFFDRQHRQCFRIHITEIADRHPVVSAVL